MKYNSANSAADFNRQFSGAYQPGFMTDSTVTFQYRFTEDPTLHLIATATNAVFVEGDTSTPTLTLYLDTRETLNGLLRGSIDGMDAFMAGQYRADGHIVLSQLMLYAFRGTSVSVDEVSR
ncbi:MAG: hypothetical protein AAF525_14425 [Pseudomonadota bacterium]